MESGMSENNLIASDDSSLQKLAEEFDRVGRELYTPDCPLYAILSSSVARDREILALAAFTRLGQAPTVLLFYTVHYLLLRGEKHSLTEFYISMTDQPAPPENAPQVFADFCREHSEEIKRLLSTRLVQTNEVLRSALLLPAIVLAAEKAGGAPLALVGLGASAGLNLFFDRYGYDYGNSLRCGDLSSPLQLSCKLRGSLRPPIPTVMPKIASRIGIDLNPLDVRNHDEYLWLFAQIWPENSFKSRAERLRLAVELVRQSPQRLITGDVVEVLREVIAEVPQDQVICLLHSFFFYELPKDRKEMLNANISRCAAKRPILSVGLEWGSDDLTLAAGLELVCYKQNGNKEIARLAKCHDHGEWMEWLYS